MIKLLNGLVAFIAASDQTGKDGYFVDSAGVIITDAFAIPYGVITDGGAEGALTTVALCAGGYAGSLTVKIAAATATISKGTRLQLTSNGTVRANIGTGTIVAVAIQAGVADELVEGVLIEPKFNGDMAIVATADRTLLAGQSGAVVSNLGAAGAVTLALPPATPGLTFTGVVEAAQQLRLDPNGTETIALPSTGVQGAAGKYLVADALTEKVKLRCITAGTWSVEHFLGTWTAEA
jgi:hypothetical protein